MKFICDEMLGKLARWLRILGIDTYYEKELSDARILAIALKEERIILTRDSKLEALKSSSYPMVLIKSENSFQQLKEVQSIFRLKFEEKSLFTRCLVCNQLLEPVPKERIKDKIYPYVYQTQNEFVFCQKCQKIYWSGSHVKRMRKKLSEENLL